MKKRLMSIVSAAAVAVTMTAGTAYLPMVGEMTSLTASAETSGDYEYTILDDGTAEITRYKGTDEVLEIPSEIDGYKVTSIGKFAFYGCETLKSITIPDGVTYIGFHAFCRCSTLNSITIPDGVTYIGSNAFSDCTSLTSITIPDSVNTMGIFVFDECESLTSVTFSNGLKGISEGTFYKCTSLASITIPNSVTSIYAHAFLGCTALETIDFSNRLKSIDQNAFLNCTSLSSVTIPKSVVLIRDNAFGYSRSNKVAKIDDFKIYCYSGTAGEKYAIDNRFEYELIDENPYVYYERGEGSVTLSWDEVEGAETYGVLGRIGNKWQVLAECEGTSYVIDNLKAGKNYKVAVAAKVNGEWITDTSKAINVTPKMPTSLYPNYTANVVKGSQIRFEWEPVPDAEMYAVAEFKNGKWRVQKKLQGGDSCSLKWTTPKLAKRTYKVVLIAKVNGQWITEKAPMHATKVSVQ